MGQQEQDASVAYEMLRSLRRILRRVATHSRKMQRAAGFTVPQLLVLRAVHRHSSEGEATVSRVGREVQLSPSTVSGVLDRLERAGLIVRSRGTAKDRRKVLLALTDAGRERLVNLPAPLEERFLDRVAKLDPAERAQLLTALEQVAELMEADGEEDPALHELVGLS